MKNRSLYYLVMTWIVSGFFANLSVMAEEAPLGSLPLGEKPSVPTVASIGAPSFQVEFSPNEDMHQINAVGSNLEAGTEQAPVGDPRWKKFSGRTYHVKVKNLLPTEVVISNIVLNGLKLEQGPSDVPPQSFTPTRAKINSQAEYLFIFELNAPPAQAFVTVSGEITGLYMNEAGTTTPLTQNFSALLINPSIMGLNCNYFDESSDITMKAALNKENYIARTEIQCTSATLAPVEVMFKLNSPDFFLSEDSNATSGVQTLKKTIGSSDTFKFYVAYLVGTKARVVQTTLLLTTSYPSQTPGDGAGGNLRNTTQTQVNVKGETMQQPVNWTLTPIDASYKAEEKKLDFGVIPQNQIDGKKSQVTVAIYPPYAFRDDKALTGRIETGNKQCQIKQTILDDHTKEFKFLLNDTLTEGAQVECTIKIEGTIVNTLKRSEQREIEIVFFIIADIKQPVQIGQDVDMGEVAFNRLVSIPTIELVNMDSPEISELLVVGPDLKPFDSSKTQVQLERLGRKVAMNVIKHDKPTLEFIMVYKVGSKRNPQIYQWKVSTAVYASTRLRSVNYGERMYGIDFLDSIIIPTLNDKQILPKEWDLQIHYPTTNMPWIHPERFNARRSDGGISQPSIEIRIPYDPSLKGHTLNATAFLDVKYTDNSKTRYEIPFLIQISNESAWLLSGAIGVAQEWRSMTCRRPGCDFPGSPFNGGQYYSVPRPIGLMTWTVRRRFFRDSFVKRKSTHYELLLGLEMTLQPSDDGVAGSIAQTIGLRVYPGAQRWWSIAGSWKLGLGLLNYPTLSYVAFAKASDSVKWGEKETQTVFYTGADLQLVINLRRISPTLDRLTCFIGGKLTAYVVTTEAKEVIDDMGKSYRSLPDSTALGGQGGCEWKID